MRLPSTHLAWRVKSDAQGPHYTCAPKPLAGPGAPANPPRAILQCLVMPCGCRVPKHTTVPAYYRGPPLDFDQLFNEKQTLPSTLLQVGFATCCRSVQQLFPTSGHVKNIPISLQHVTFSSTCSGKCCSRRCICPGRRAPRLRPSRSVSRMFLPALSTRASFWLPHQARRGSWGVGAPTASPHAWKLNSAVRGCVWHTCDSVNQSLWQIEMTSSLVRGHAQVSVA